MSDITPGNVFSGEQIGQIDFANDNPGVEDYAAQVSDDDLIVVTVALAGAAKLWEILNEEQRDSLSPFQRAALQRLHSDANEYALIDDFATGLDKFFPTK